jgi:hypothetical protein
VQVEVSDAVKAATAHLQCLGAEVIEVNNARQIAFVSPTKFLDVVTHARATNCGVLHQSNV